MPVLLGAPGDALVLVLVDVLVFVDAHAASKHAATAKRPLTLALSPLRGARGPDPDLSPSPARGRGLG
jgi:hypothetical protein